MTSTKPSISANAAPVSAPESAPKSEQVVNDAPRLFDVFEVGDRSHQGDIIIIRIAALPASAKIRQNRQIAEGTTQGSRHILARGTVYNCDRDEVARAIESATKRNVAMDYIGPVFVSPANPTKNDLTHPEHGNQGFPAGAVCAVVYQRNMDAEQRERRVQD